MDKEISNEYRNPCFRSLANYKFDKGHHIHISSKRIWGHEDDIYNSVKMDDELAYGVLPYWLRIGKEVFSK
jgi:hypothetical protein